MCLFLTLISMLLHTQRVGRGPLPGLVVLLQQQVLAIHGDRLTTLEVW